MSETTFPASTIGPAKAAASDSEVTAGEPIPGWLRRTVLVRDDYYCRYCGRRTQTLDIDHVIPVKYGGQSTVDNLVTACAKCSRRKNGRTLEEARMMLL